MAQKNNKSSIEKTVTNAKKVLTDLEQQAKDVDETVKGAVVGGVLGYLVSEDNKERNIVIGAGLGYAAGKYAKGKKKDF